MELHREDIKAAIRKEFGSVARFEREHGLPIKSVTDFLRGRRSARVESAVNSVIPITLPSQSPNAMRPNPYPRRHTGSNQQ